MVRTPDGWRYAHTDGTSCYMATHYAWDAKDGQTAERMRKHDNTLDSVITAEKQLAAEVGTLVVFRSGIEDEI
jgi:hypothetical protein